MPEDGAEERVSVDVVRSGGFGGVRRAGRVDTAELDPERAETLRTLVAEAALRSRATGTRSGTGGADRFQYDVTVERQGNSRTFVLTESDLSDADRRLLRWVLSEGRPAT